MHNGIRRVPDEHRIHGVAIADVGADEGVAGAVGDGLERAQVGGVGELVDVDDVRVGLAHEVAAYRRADEARSPCDDDLHRYPPLTFRLAFRPTLTAHARPVP